MWPRRLPILKIAARTLHTFAETRAIEAAASIAYYALFSLFPLLLLMITFGTSVLRNEQTVDLILDYTANVLPTAQTLVKRNIEQVLALRGTVGVFAAIGLLWSATGVFNTLARNINLAWEGAKQRNFLKSRLVALLMFFTLAALPILSLASTTLFSLLPWLDLDGPLWGGVSIYDTFIWAMAKRLIPWFFIFIMFLGLYRWVPNIDVDWSEAVWGALVAASGWEVAKFGFTWFLRSGLASYQLVYGSLGTVVALMLWIYLSSVVILFGAHLSGAVTYYRKKRT
ncbi:MAG: YihY/virulence factor BrkB family protein [Anaerolineae bacterium]|nr:YihY/virulence factor BrkB family protein [Anaerolineae bacterium]